MAAGDWESYLWPGSDVLRNKLGLRDRDVLQAAEYPLVAYRRNLIVSGAAGIPRTFDATHLKALHGFLFGDVYEWAGQYRTVDMAKGSTTFAEVAGIEQYLTIASVVAATGDAWSTVDAEQFAERIARAYGYLNQAHPFREGNGRAAKLWLAQLAEQSPWRLDYAAVSETEWVSACARASRLKGSFVPASEHLVPVMQKMTVADGSLAATGMSPELQRLRAVYKAAYPAPAQTGGSPTTGTPAPPPHRQQQPGERRGRGYQR